MSQATLLQGLIMLFVIVLYMINTARKSNREEDSSMRSPRATGVARAKPVLKPQKVLIAEEKEDSSSTLRKKSTSRAKKILNQSLLRQSILRSEILRKKY